MSAAFTAFALLCAFAVAGQEGYTTVDGKKYPYTISECGDTLILADLGNVSVSSMRNFANDEEYLRYRRYRRYAADVYPYAVEAVRIFREVDYATDNLKERQRKKYIKQLQKELKDEFSEPLKKLTKTQGFILIKMIERELQTPMFDLIKDLRGGFTANYWNFLGGFYGHHLKDGYAEGNDHILDAVLSDLSVSYDVPTRRPTGLGE